MFTFLFDAKAYTENRHKRRTNEVTFLGPASKLTINPLFDAFIPEGGHSYSHRWHRCRATAEAVFESYLVVSHVHHVRCLQLPIDFSLLNAHQCYKNRPREHVYTRAVSDEI
ncbi:unnamed protein product [Ixodes persulcatus]